jgi:hypothetical protein
MNLIKSIQNRKNYPMTNDTGMGALHFVFARAPSLFIAPNITSRSSQSSQDPAKAHKEACTGALKAY